MSPLKKYDTFWPRFGAGVIDGILFAPLMWGIFVLLQRSHATLTFVPLFVLFQYAFITYSITMHARYGQTLGKMVTNVKVMDISEEPLSPQQAVMRDLPYLAILSLETVFGLFWAFEASAPSFDRVVNSNNVVFEYVDSGWFILEVITMLFSQKRRALHDFIADSVVVRI
jgi:uncharacterized RDD family membrane protein YckC